MTDPADERFADEIRATANVRYLVVYDGVNYVPAKVTEEGFVADPLDLAVGLYDRREEKWLLMHHFEIQPPNGIKFRLRNNTLEENGQFAILEHFMDKGRPLIADYLSELTGGTFEFDSRAYRRDGTRLGDDSTVFARSAPR